MATVKYEVLHKKENAQIYLGLSVKRGLTFKRKVGKTINYKYWNFKTKKIKQNSSTTKNLSIDLQKLKTFILERVNDANSNGSTITSEWLKHSIDVYYDRVTEDKQSELLIDAINAIIDNAETRKNNKGGIGLSKSRVNAYISLKNKLIGFQGKNTHKVKDVGIKFANDFLKYLLKEKTYQKSTALKLIADLKTVCYNAELNGIKVNTQLKKIESAKTNNDSIIYLSNTELHKIEKTELTSDALQNARKWLLLGCNIGQRGGDLLKINENNFVTRNGLQVIELKQQKTNKNVTIPVLETTKQILKNGLPYKISTQKFNQYIKKICKLAEINEPTKGNRIKVMTKDKIKRSVTGIYPKYELISSHVCRRSFASNLYGTMPTPLIMQITAHSTEKMFLNYIGKDSLDFAQQIADFYTLQAQKQKKETNLTVVNKASNQN